MVNNTDIKQHVDHLMHLVSQIFPFNKKRYTGMFALEFDDSIEKKSGVNMEDYEWAEFTNQFPKNKQALKDRESNQKRPTKRKLSYASSSEEEDIIDFEVYQLKYFVDGEELKSFPVQEYYSEEKAKLAQKRIKLTPGVDYANVDGKVTSEISSIPRAPPTEVFLMKFLYVTYLKEIIENMRKKECSACLLESDSQSDHMAPGNCLDESFDYYTHFMQRAMDKVFDTDLMILFGNALKCLNIDPIRSKPYACAAKAYLNKDDLVDMLNSFEGFPMYLRDLVSNHWTMIKGTVKA